MSQSKAIKFKFISRACFKDKIKRLVFLVKWDFIGYLIEICGKMQGIPFLDSESQCSGKMPWLYILMGYFPGLPLWIAGHILCFGFSGKWITQLKCYTKEQLEIPNLQFPIWSLENKVRDCERLKASRWQNNFNFIQALFFEKFSTIAGHARPLLGQNLNIHFSFLVKTNSR